MIGLILNVSNKLHDSQLSEQQKATVPITLLSHGKQPVHKLVHAQLTLLTLHAHNDNHLQALCAHICQDG